MKAAILLAGLLSVGQAQAKEVEFLHWWTSNGEYAALKVLKEHLAKNQYHLNLSAVEGGGGISATTVLQARALAGNTPNFAQIEGPSIKAWDAIGIVHPLNATAKQSQWDEHLYPLSKDINSTGNGYVALPLTLHRLNWLYVNHQLLKALQIDVPKTWPDMFKAMEKAHAAGINPLAIGDEPWQISQLFESLVIAAGGVEFYQTTLVELNKNNLDSAQMRHVFKQFRRLSELIDSPLKDTKWNTATEALIENQALFQIGGDWVLGDLLASGLSIPQDIGCYPAPQSHRSFLYNMDSFIFMASKGFGEGDANQLASVLAQEEFQVDFNRAKGSIPVRADIDLADFSQCQQISHQDFIYAIENDLAVPTMTDSMAVNPVAQQAIISEIYRYYHNLDVTENEVIKRMISITESN